MKLTLKKLRNDKGWTLDHLAAVSGVSKGFLSQLETGKRQPSSAILSTLAETFGVQVKALIEADHGSATQDLLTAFEMLGEDDQRAILHLAQKMAGNAA